MSYSPQELAEHIRAYLATGGLFNPELADHDAVRDLLIECRAALIASPNRDAARGALTDAQIDAVFEACRLRVHSSDNSGYADIRLRREFARAVHALAGGGHEMSPTDAQVEAAYKALDWDMKKKEACQLIRKVWRAMNDAAAVPSEAPQAEAWGQEPSAFIVRRDYAGGCSEWLCETRGDAEEMAKDAVGLPNPDKIIPLYKAEKGRDAAQKALEKIAETMSSDWPERCIENVRIARAALAPDRAAERGVWQAYRQAIERK